MSPIGKKINVGIALLLFFFITLVTGIMLHLKKHGIIIEPRPVIKTIHWVSGFVMVILTCIHGSQFRKMFSSCRQRLHLFWHDTWGVIIFTALTFITGLIKLLSPVKIPHLGLWHYWLGIIMSALIIIHLFRGLPTLCRMIRGASK